MGRVRITLTPSDRPTDQRAIITAADGRFSFNVPKGKFGITAEIADFASLSAKVAPQPASALRFSPAPTRTRPTSTSDGSRPEPFRGKLSMIAASPLKAR